MDHDHSAAHDLAGTELVRRMGHDFNNLFGIVLGGLSLLREELKGAAWTQDSEDTYRDLVSATREAADVVAKLTAWAGRQALDPERLELGAVAEEAADLARTRFRPEVVIEVAHGARPIMAWADRARLREAVGELLANASDAIDGSGTIRVLTRAGAMPAITVSDAGCGMSAQQIAACREPYFTTRGGLGRRGLGLSVVAGFVRASGGTLEVSSEPGAGTRATVALPGSAPAGT